MAFASGDSSGGRKWSESELQVEDEFTCSAALRGAVLALQATVKRVFRVELDIAVEEGVEVHQTGLMWLQLKGRSGDVLAAKLFVKGVVNQEEQQEVPYPKALYCVFCGARGLFMDCLIRNTSAQIMVGSPGCLLISGLAEPVVRAYSLIIDLVERYDSQGQRMDAGARVTGDSLDSRRAFKELVERWDDRHTLDLLVLPVSVKEVLLELVRESHWNTATIATADTVVPQTDMDEPRVVGQSGTAMADSLSHRMPAEQLDTSLNSPGSSVVPTSSDSIISVGSQHSHQHQGASATSRRESLDTFFRSFAVVDGAPREQVEGADEQQEWRRGVPQEVVDEVSRMEVAAAAGAEGRQDDLGLLLKFFTAMGFKEDTVKRVLSRTGALDPFDLLELVQREQDQEDGRGGRGGEENISRRSGDGAEGEPAFSSRSVERGAPSHATSLGSSGNRSPGVGLPSGGGGEKRKEEEGDDDFVFGVMKRAAASCGYTEEQVREVCSNLPELSFQQLILELQRQGKPAGTNTAEATAASASYTAPPQAKESLTDSTRKEAAEVRKRNEEESRTLREKKAKASVDDRNKEREGDNQRNLLGRQPSAKTVASLDDDILEHRAIERYLIDQAYRNSGQEAAMKREGPVVVEPYENLHGRPPVTGAAGSNTRTHNWNTFSHQNHQNHHRGSGHMDPTANGGSSSIRGPPRPSYPHEVRIPPQMNPHLSATMPGPLPRLPQRQGLPQMSAGAIVTGQQRFLEGLRMPFQLKLSGDSGDTGLRQIIIDGSNVAMSHGLGQFFSCRGIALAVQHFWDKGHRQISALVPQWRQKRDPRVQEQDYLSQLQDLGLLSFTPSREVMGKRINSYDDRFMLQLAQKTNGVIVTNDNMRDLFDESDDFKDIIRKSLLQYTFVGDHFMLPDDPLGRDGPHLNDFLRSQQSRKFAPHKHPQSEPLQFHNRAPEGGRVAPKFQSDRPDVQSQGWEQVQRRGGRGGGRGRLEPDAQKQRSAEETSRLRESLMQVFPGEASAVALTLQRHPALTDVNLLSHFILEGQTAGE